MGIRLRPQVLANLQLWMSFLRIAFKGSVRTPTHVFWSNAAEHGMGGCCGLSGKASSLKLPWDCKVVGCCEGFLINLFEFLGGILSI
jgi:hypothetical protein